MLIAYGAHDELVPPAATAATWMRLHDESRRAFYPGGYHLLMRDKNRQAVIGDVASWIFEPQRALPSGADVSAAGRGAYGRLGWPGSCQAGSVRAMQTALDP